MAVAAFVAGDEWEAAAYRNRIESCTVGCCRLHRSPGRSVDEEPIACRGALATRHIPAVDCWAARMHVDSRCVVRRRRLLVRDPATLYLGIGCHPVHAREFTLRWPPPWVCWVGVGRHPMVWELTSPWLGPLWRSYRGRALHCPASYYKLSWTGLETTFSMTFNDLPREYCVGARSLGSTSPRPVRVGNQYKQIMAHLKGSLLRANHPSWARTNPAQDPLPLRRRPA